MVGVYQSGNINFPVIFGKIRFKITEREIERLQINYGKMVGWSYVSGNIKLKKIQIIVLKRYKKYIIR